MAQLHRELTNLDPEQLLAQAEAGKEAGRLRVGYRQLSEYFTEMAERDEHEQAQAAYHHAAAMVVAVHEAQEGSEG